MKEAKEQNKKLAAELAGEVGFFRRYQHYIFGALGLLIGVASTVLALSVLNENPSTATRTSEPTSPPEQAPEEQAEQKTSTEEPRESQ